MITALRSRAELELDRFALDPYCKLYLPLWKLDGDSFADHSAYGHLCTNYGSLWTPQGRSFDGVDDYVDCGNDTSLNFDMNDFTVEVWAKAISGTYARGIINKGGWHLIGYSIQQAVSPANQYYFVVTDSVGHKQIELSLSETWDWTHIVGIKTTNHLEAWVNGIKVGEYNGAIGSLSNPTKKFEIGRSFDPYYFNGLISKVRIYSRALRNQEILDHYIIGKEMFG